MGSMDMVFAAIMCFFVALAIEKFLPLPIGIFVGAVTVQLIKYAIIVLGISGQFNNAGVAMALIIICAISSESKYIMAFRNKFKRRKEVA